MVLEWALGLPTPGLIFSAAVSLYISREHGRLEPPGILCESCSCIIHTINLQSCMSIISETLHDQSFSQLKRASQIPSYQILGTSGQESVYETCACVIHTILLSYMCINIVSHFTLMFARGTCAS